MRSALNGALAKRMSCQGFLLCEGLLAYWLKMTYNECPGGGGGATAAEGAILRVLGRVYLGRVCDEY